MSGKSELQVQKLLQAQPEYGVTARFYDETYDKEQSARDSQFYGELAAAQDGPVLELGCGTGRILLSLARQGKHVVGLDLAEPMLDQLKQKLAKEPREVQDRVTLVQGDMTNFELDERFGLVLAPFRAFQHLMDSSQQRSCVERIARHLRPDGLYVHNSFNPNLQYIVDAMKLAGTWKLVNEFTVESSGQVVLRYVQLQPNPARQVQGIRWRFEVFDAAGALQETLIEDMELRWLYRWEAEYLMELCGLEIVEAYGDFDKRPLDEQANELIYLCRKKAKTADNS
jgi:SAM-dependent methyltransferase